MSDSPAPDPRPDVVDGARRAIENGETRCYGSFVESLELDLAPADTACALLLGVLTTVDKRTAELVLGEDGETVVGGDVRTLQLQSQVYVGIRGFRSIRAGRAVLAAGYEPEARAHDRVLIELQAHRTAILADATGNEALAWLQGKRGFGITKRVAAIGSGSKDLYRNLSQDSHGDPVPVGRLYDHEADALMLSPKRTRAARASLWLYAGFARDQAVVIAQLAGMTLGGVDKLDSEIRAVQERLLAEESADPGR